MKHRLSLVILAGFVASSTGCAMLESGKHTMAESMKMFRPNPHDGPVEFDRDAGEDEWEFVGREGRADQDRERDPDRWWQNLVMSPRAKTIERSLGID